MFLLCISELIPYPPYRLCGWRAPSPSAPATWWWSPLMVDRTQKRAWCWAWTSAPLTGLCVLLLVLLS